MIRQPVSGVLRCQECSGFSVHAVGWIAVLIDGKPDEQASVATYCPACAEREFDIHSLRADTAETASREAGALEAAAAKARWRSVFLNRHAEELVTEAGEQREQARDLLARVARRRRERVTAAALRVSA